jgi:hypothetical protein
MNAQIAGPAIPQAYLDALADPMFTTEGALLAEKQARVVYELFDADSELELRSFPGDHDLKQPVRGALSASSTTGCSAWGGGGVRAVAPGCFLARDDAGKARFAALVDQDPPPLVEQLELVSVGTLNALKAAHRHRAPCGPVPV